MNLEDDYLGLKKCVVNDYPYSIDWDDSLIMPVFVDTYTEILHQHAQINNSYYSDGFNGKIMLNFMDHYVILAFRFAHNLWKTNLVKLAECVYYSVRVRGSIDLFYTTEIGPYFMPTHSLGSVVDSHVKYGKLFKLYNGVHIGPYNIVGVPPKEWEHPSIGDYVTVLNGAKIFGNTVIEDNVIISANTLIINEEIPSNCIVSGASPNLFFQRLKVKNSDYLIPE